MLSRRAILALGAASILAPARAVSQEQREGEGGIGGTGIVGVLTDFGSLIVAGTRVETGPITRFEDAFGALSENSLRVGDSLTVEASGPPDQLVARRVRVTYPLIGTITDILGQSLVINGVPVRLERSESLARVGSRVAVHGVWRGDEVVASRLAAPRSESDLIAGTANRQRLRMRIGPLEMRGRGRGQLQDGGFGEAIGAFDREEGVFDATRINTQRFVGVQSSLTRLAVEGYLEPSRGNPGFRVSGLGHSFRRNVSLSAFAGDRTLFVGDYDGLFAPRQATRLPEDFASRRALLRGLVE